MRKPAFCTCEFENKDTDQLHADCADNQRLRFRYIIGSGSFCVFKTHFPVVKFLYSNL